VLKIPPNKYNLLFQETKEWECLAPAADFLVRTDFHCLLLRLNEEKSSKIPIPPA
jgi:hypothetical protein